MFSKFLTSTRNNLLFLSVLSLIVYIGTSLKFGISSDIGLLEPDELEYYHLSTDLLQGEISGRRPLVHLLALAVLRVVTADNLVAIQLIITAIFSLVSPLMYLLGYRLFRNRTLALLVGFLIAVWPPFVYYGGTLYSESIILPFFVGLLILFPKGSLLGETREQPWWVWVLCGSLLGLCILIRPMYLFFVPFAVAIVFLEERQWLVALKRSAVLVVSCLLLMLPWSIYLSMHVGKPTLISTTGGETLSGGLNPVLIQQGYRFYRTADGRETWDGPGKWLTISRNGYLSSEEQSLPYAEKDKLLQQRAIAWILKHPGEVLYLQACKLLYMWGFYPFWNGKLQTWFGNFPSVVCVVCSGLAMLRFRAYWRQLSRFWVLPIFVSTVTLVSWGSWRFRQPGDLGILVLTSLLLLSFFLKPKQLFALPQSREASHHSN